MYFSCLAVTLFLQNVDRNIYQIWGKKFLLSCFQKLFSVLLFLSSSSEFPNYINFRPLKPITLITESVAQIGSSPLIHFQFSDLFFTLNTTVTPIWQTFPFTYCIFSILEFSPVFIFYNCNFCAEALYFSSLCLHFLSDF